MANLDRWERIARWFMTAWFVLAVPTAVSILLTGINVVNLGLVFAFAAWGSVWAWLWLRAIGRDQTGAVLGLVGITVFLTLFTLISPSPETSFLVFSFMAAGIVFPLRQVLWALLALVALQIALSVVRLTPAPVAFNLLFNSALVGVLAIGVRLFWQSYTQLVAAREQLAHLAVTEERLRFARDLHDVLGQNLSVLVLKSELVAKQLPADADESLRHEVRDIAQVARKSLNDVRETVSGYRQATLQAEISSARTALRSAGIGMKVEDTLGALPPEQDGVLAWCLREAVTNVVKHSGAKRCEVRLTRAGGEARLEVMDDGRGATSFDGGSGLAGMKERVDLVGGTLRVGSENGGGMHLQVSVPQAS
ncbi:MAG TPA: sensor histidine kinase [Candidatus Dormibacteraeota bacterium]|nr:sensor histidine kinase [Candidatus Dormibacteraeota bacterium]